MIGRCAWIKSDDWRRDLHASCIYLLFILVLEGRFEKTEQPGLSSASTQTDFEWCVVESLCVTGSICCVAGPPWQSFDVLFFLLLLKSGALGTSHISGYFLKVFVCEIAMYKTLYLQYICGVFFMSLFRNLMDEWSVCHPKGNLQWLKSDILESDCF